MSQTLQNQILLAKSMNGIVSLSDGAGTTITGGQVITNDFSGNTITVNSFSTGTLDLNNSLTLEQYDNIYISPSVGSVSLFEKGKSFFFYLPQSFATPSNPSDFITLFYANNNYAKTTASNTWTGVNTFNNNFVADCPSAGTVLLKYDNTTMIEIGQYALYSPLSISPAFGQITFNYSPVFRTSFSLDNFITMFVGSPYAPATLEIYTDGVINSSFKTNTIEPTIAHFDATWYTTFGDGKILTFGNNTSSNELSVQFANTTFNRPITILDNITANSLTITPTQLSFLNNVSSGTIPTSAISGYGTGLVDTTTNQTVAGIKTFSSPPVMSGASITSSTIADGALSSNVGLLTGTQTFTGAKTFSDLTAASPLKITETSSIVQIAGGSTPYNVLKYNNLYDSIGIGKDTLNSLTTNAFWNIAIGSNALTTAQASRGCIGIGRDALKLFNGLAASYSYNVAIGTLSMQSATTAAQCCALGGTTAQNLTSATGCTFLGNGTDFISTTQYNNSTAIGNNAKITAANQIMMGTSLETVNIPGSCSITGTCSITGATSIGGTLTVKGQQQSSAFTTLLTGTANFSGGLTHSAYSVVPPTTAFTITLPTITAANVGTQVVFRRITATNATTVVSFIGNGSQFVYNAAATGGTTAQPLMASGVYTVRLVSLVITTTPTYAWFMV